MFCNPVKVKGETRYIPPAVDTNFFLSFPFVSELIGIITTPPAHCPSRRVIVLILLYRYRLLLSEGLPCGVRNKLPIRINETPDYGLHRCGSVTHPGTR